MRTGLMSELKRAMRIALACEKLGISTKEGLQRERAAGMKRREFLGAAGAAALATTVGMRRGHATPRADVDVAIIGAGMAGLACADRLVAANVHATIYEAGSRVGGRQHTTRNLFPNQVSERGGEFIDNLHKVMLGYANRFNLAREDVNKNPGEVFYYFNGAHVPEHVVVDEYRALVAAMHDDLQSSTGVPTADFHNDADVALDNMSITQYLQSRGAGAMISKAVIAAYEAEYGLTADKQSALNFLLFIHADKRSKFTPFGVYSDERFHVTSGNDGIASSLAASLPGPIELGMKLVRIAKTAAGRVELTFQQGNRTVVKTHESAVITVPFTVLRGVQIHSSVGLPDWKKFAIDNLGYGTNAKMMIGFSTRVWSNQGSNGASYSDLANHQTTWETNWTRATASSSILTDYSSGPRGATIDDSRFQQEAAAFLTDCDRVYPGAKSAATKDSKGKYRGEIANWTKNPLSLGSYTCYTPGQFTSLCGNEGKQVGNLYFAGEHANSFYVWQGFMEGAAISGIDAANQVLADN